MQKLNKHKKRMMILAVVVFAGVAMYLFVHQLIPSKAKQFNQANIRLPADENKQVENSIADAALAALEGTKGTYGIVIKDVKTGEEYSMNEDRVFDAGSLYKLWVMTTAFNKIQTGAWKEDQVLSEDVSTLNDKFYIDPDGAEQTEGTIVFTVRDAVEHMITMSHNYAALLLTEKLKLSNVKSFLEENGLKHSTVGTDGSTPTATPKDMALFFEKLYTGELANTEYTDTMLDVLKKQQLNDKLPKYLPHDTIIAHKTGEIDSFSHDAGIVYSPHGNYIIVVLSESDSPKGAEERIALVSKAVYEYFERKK